MRKSLTYVLAASFIAISCLVLSPVRANASQPTKDEQKTIEEIKKRIEKSSEDEEPGWIHEIIVGWQLLDDKEIKKKIKNTTEWILDEDFSLEYHKDETKLSKKEFEKSIFKIGSYGFDATDRFEIYALHDNSKMYVVTPDDSYLEIPVGPISMRENWPDCGMADYDGDGENELMIGLDVLHGTEYKEKSLIIVDKSENGTWFAYHMPVDFYEEYFNKHISSKCKDGNLLLCLDGKTVGNPIKTKSADAYFNCRSLIDIFPCGNVFLVGSSPYPYNEKSGSPIGEFSDNKIWLSVKYSGCGEFAIVDAMAQPRAETLYEKEIEKVSSKQFYGFVEGPAVEIPLMLISDSVIEQVTAYDEDSIYEGHSPCFCDVYLMKNGKMTNIGTIEGGTNVYPVSFDENGIILRDHHRVETYYVENDKLILNEGVQDEIVCMDGRNEGFGIYGGKKFRKISEKFYWDYRYELAKGHDIYFIRGSK